MTHAQERRIAQLRFRVATRQWEYRQREHARGVWHRLRRILADAREAWVIEAEEADRLIAEGHVPEPVGLQLEPDKRIFFVPDARLQRLTTAKRVPVRLDPQLLGARCIALRRFSRS